MGQRSGLQPTHIPTPAPSTISSVSVKQAAKRSEPTEDVFGHVPAPGGGTLRAGRSLIRVVALGKSR